MSKETLSTSETKKETPKHVNALEEKYKEQAKEEPHHPSLFLVFEFVRWQ